MCGRSAEQAPAECCRTETQESVSVDHAQLQTDRASVVLQSPVARQHHTKESV